MNRHSFFTGVTGAIGSVLGLFGLRREVAAETNLLRDDVWLRSHTCSKAHATSVIEWIPVEGRLPEEDKPVFVWNGLKSFKARWFTVCGTCWWFGHNPILSHHRQPTHWAELPKGPTHG